MRESVWESAGSLLRWSTMARMPVFPILSPALQIGFYERLQQAQKAHLLPALLEQVGQMDIGALDGELLEFVGSARLSAAAKYLFKNNLAVS